MKKVSKIFTVLFGIALFMMSSLYAGSATVSTSVSKTTLASGATATIYVNVTSSSKIRGASFTVTSSGNVEVVSVAGANGFTSANNGNMYSLQNLSGNALKSGSSIATITVKAKSNATDGATGSISVSGAKVSIQDDGNPYTVSGGSRTVNFTVSNSASSGNGSGTSAQAKSSDATLKSLSTDVLKLDFNRNKTEYTVYVDKTVDSLGLKAVVNNSKATVKITGDENFKVGINVVKVTVTAENGTTKVYTINVIKSAYRWGALKSLEVKVFGLNREFDPDKLEYTITISGAYFETTKLDMEYEAANADATVTVEGNENFVVGKNTVKITVTEKNGTQVTYTLNVIKEPAMVDADNNDCIWIVIISILAVLIIAETVYIIIKKKKSQKSDY